MKTIEVDVAVIGAGSAGLAAFRAARSHGVRTLLIERGPYGTTCARVGCMPSKLLIAAAEAAHAVSEAGGFGVLTEPPRIDDVAVLARVRNERDRFVGFVLDGVAQIDPTERLTGRARFIGPQRLQVDEHTIVNAARIVIATGSRPLIPPEYESLGDRLVTNDEVFDWTVLPASVAVIGAGVIGLEIGQALHRLGVRVAVFGKGDKLAALSDPVVTAAAVAALSAEFDVRLGTRSLKAVRASGADGVQICSVDAGGTEHTENFALVLCAVGRRPNLEELDLQHSGLALNRKGIPHFDRTTMQCGSSTVFIAGDADDERPLLHEAVDQGRIAGDNAGRFPAVAPGLRRAGLGVVFCAPQIALAGQAFKELTAGTFATGTVSFAEQGRARVMRQNRGVLHVYGEHGSGRILGAEMIGPRAEHLAHLLAWACQMRMTVRQMLDMPFYHPVIEEGLRTALRQLQEQLDAGMAAIERCADCTPGM